MSVWIILTIVCLSMLAVLLIVIAQQQTHRADHAAQRRFFELLEKNSNDEASADKNWMRGAVRHMGQSKLARWFPAIEHAETLQLLKQAGWHSRTGSVLFYIITWLLPIVVTIVCFILLLLFSSEFNNQAWATLFIVATLGFLVPKHVLRRAAKERRSKLSREMPTAIHLLRMLFDAGLSTERALRVMHSEGELLTPELSKELAKVLLKIDVGMDPADALAEMAAPLEVNELDDTVAILRQVSSHGGNIRETLVKFAELMEERQLSTLREYINVLSGKMSVVMMIFLFPALLIFLAGPGFIALAKGLSGVL